MEYIFQFLIILSVSLVGEILHYFIPLPIPASIYGLVIMFVLLITKAVDVKKVKGAADYLLAIMTLMFIPAAVGIVDVWEQTKAMLPAVLCAIIIGTVITMASTGLITQAVIRKDINKQGKGDNKNG